VYDILIASPNDVSEERKTVREAIYQWNAINSRKFNAILEPVTWETHSRSEMGDRPQALLNKQIVEACDILIALFWTRLGTPTGSESSGTVEEIKKFLDAGKPVIVYFSNKPVDRANISDQIKMVDDYKMSLRVKGICFEFSSFEELNGLLNKDISFTIFSLLKRYELSTPSEEDQEFEDYIFKENYNSIRNFYQKFDVEWSDEYFSDLSSFQQYKDVMKLYPVLEWAYEELWKIYGDMNEDELNHQQSLIKTALLKIKSIKDVMKKEDDSVGIFAPIPKTATDYVSTCRKEIFFSIETSMIEIKALIKKSSIH
jgi:hypothetical protein